MKRSFLSLLSEQNCVLNLRWSPCQATVDDLGECVNAFLVSRSQTQIGAYCDACAAFEAAQGCDQTVFQKRYANMGAPVDETCGIAVPIAPGTVCDTSANP